MNKIVHYRAKCIGCAICYEMQPALWRLSKKDGKATLVRAERKKQVYVRTIPIDEVKLAEEVANACPVKIIKITNGKFTS